MNRLEFCEYLHIEQGVVDVWVEQAWLIPDISGGEPFFHDSDLARARLILDLSERMGLNEPGVDVVMDLVDQLHSLHAALTDIISAIEVQEPDVKIRILRHARER